MESGGTSVSAGPARFVRVVSLVRWTAAGLAGLSLISMGLLIWATDARTRAPEERSAFIRFLTEGGFSLFFCALIGLVVGAGLYISASIYVRHKLAPEQPAEGPWR